MEELPKPPKPVQVPEGQVPQSDTKPVKEKKPRSEAQQAATSKALAAMTAKRRQMNDEHREKKEEVKQAVKVVKEKILKDKVGFASLTDIDSLKKELYELKGMLTAKQQMEKDKSLEKPQKAERIVERVIERQAPTAPAPPSKLTGHALLDKLFFEK